MSEQFRSFSIEAAQTAEIRTAKHLGEDYLVVPVVMMVGDTAIEPLNSDGPEFVPTEVISVVPEQWNGEPVMPVHPLSKSGQPVSANTPEVFEKYSFGKVYNAHFSDNKLKAEAWISLSRASEVEGAKEVIEQLRAGMAEISIGAYVSFVDATGTANGKTYNKAWADVRSDHLAIFGDGSVGACSNELGCGAPRINQSGEAMPKDMTVEGVLSLDTTGFHGMLSRLKSLIGLSSSINDNQSVNQLNRALNLALSETVVGFQYVEDFDPAEGTVIYTARNTQDEWESFQRSFSTSEDGSVELSADTIQVEPVLTWQPVASEQDPDSSIVEDESSPVSDAGCQCQSKGEQTLEGETMNENVKQLVSGLIANEDTPFAEGSEESLAALGEDALTALAEKYTAAEEVDEPDSVEEDLDISATDTGDLTEDEQIEALPEALKSLVRKAQSAERERRGTLITQLKSAQSRFSEAQLKDKDTEFLEDLSAILKLDKPAVDNSGRGLSANRESDDSAPTPPSLAGKIRERRGVN